MYKVYSNIILVDLLSSKVDIWHLLSANSEHDAMFGKLDLTSKFNTEGSKVIISCQLIPIKQIRFDDCLVWTDQQWGS